MRKIAIAVALTAAMGFAGARNYAQFPAAPGTGPGLAETIEAIDSARVTTRILYVTAHPDDESAAVLTYLARGLHADVALLSLTRGEGGQNALGPEQAPQLGLIRTHELLAATRGYGVKLYFTRAKDFGYCKTPEEAEKVWGDQVLEDMVRVIRSFRPNIVINGWGGVHQGHGHHQAAGLLTPKAVALAADVKYLRGNLGTGRCCGEVFVHNFPWGDAEAPVQILNLERGSETPNGYILPLDEISALWGKSWRELGLDAFVSHRTQGISAFINSPFLRRPIALKNEDGGAFNPKSLAAPLREFGSWCSAFAEGDRELAKAREKALSLDWEEASKSVLDANEKLTKGIEKCGPIPAALQRNEKASFDIPQIQIRIRRAAALAAGAAVTATADRAALVKGEEFQVEVGARCRPEVHCVFGSPDLSNGQRLDEKSRQVTPMGNVRASLMANGRNDESSVWGQFFPESATFQVNQKLAVGTKEFSTAQPIARIEVSSTEATQLPLRIVPAYTLAVEPRQEIEKLAAKHEPFDVFLRVHSYSQKAATVSVGLDVPAGWKSSGAMDVSFTGEGDRYAKLTVTPPTKMEAGHYTITAYAKRGEEKFTTSIEPLVSMPTLTWEEPAQTVVHAFDIKVLENLRVGYISAESEPVPGALKMLGIKVEMLDANALNFGDLSKYDAIVVGVRAYELRSELPGANQRLLDYAQNGGTLVVQYQRDFAWDGKNYAPYAAKIANKPGDPLPRITDENSPVKFLKPDDSLLNTPNKITQDDFKGWVQERGLYFWSEYDSRYTALLAMNDPGEKDLDGALLYTKLGKGTYIYTGIAFFRQLPEGVPGAYRLFVNLLSASRLR